MDRGVEFLLKYRLISDGFLSFFLNIEKKNRRWELRTYQFRSSLDWHESRFFWQFFLAKYRDRIFNSVYLDGIRLQAVSLFHENLRGRTQNKLGFGSDCECHVQFSRKRETARSARHDKITMTKILFFLFIPFWKKCQLKCFQIQ